MNLEQLHLFGSKGCSGKRIRFRQIDVSGRNCTMQGVRQKPLGPTGKSQIKHPKASLAVDPDWRKRRRLAPGDRVIAFDSCLMENCDQPAALDDRCAQLPRSGRGFSRYLGRKGCRPGPYGTPGGFRGLSYQVQRTGWLADASARRCFSGTSARQWLLLAGHGRRQQIIDDVADIEGLFRLVVVAGEAVLLRLLEIGFHSGVRQLE